MKKEQVINFNGEQLHGETNIAESATVIPVIEEQITVEKRVVEAGKVRISKHARQIEEIVDVPLLHEQVSVEHVPVNKVVEERLPTRYDGDTLIIPVVEEQIIVQKRLVLVEELHIRKQTIESREPQRVNLLKEEVEITRVVENENSGS